MTVSRFGYSESMVNTRCEKYLEDCSRLHDIQRLAPTYYYRLRQSIRKYHERVLKLDGEQVRANRRCDVLFEFNENEEREKKLK